MKKIRMALLIVVLVIALVACSNDGTDSAQDELKKVTFVLDWTPNTNHTGIYVAVEKGYFADNGLKVEIIQPTENSVEQLLAAGTAQFGIVFQDFLTFARDEGIPVVSIGAILQHNTSVLASPADRGIQSAKDFEGKVYGGWGSDVETATIQYMMEQDGGDFSKLEITTIGDTDFLTASDMGTVDIGWIFAGWEGMRAEIEGMELTYIPFADEDVFDYYAPIMATSEDMIKNDSETVQAFMNAVVKGYEFAAQNSKESADILLKYVPELDEELVYASQEYLSPRYIDDAASFGIQKKEVWDRYTQWLYDNGFIENLVDSDSAFTNDFLQ